MANTYLPIGYSLEGKHCLVVGGGEVALRKVENLLDYECRITVIALEVHDKLEYFANSNRITLEKRAYAAPEAKSYGLVVAAVGKKELNARIAEDAKSAGVPVNVVDAPDLCTFIFPATLKRRALTVAVSTDGEAPFLAGHLRAILEEVFPERWNTIADAASAFRSKVKARWPGANEKQMACFERFVAADWKEVLKKGDEGVEEELEKLLGE